MDNAPVHAFARRLAERNRPVWVRFVLVPGLTDDPEEISQIARFAADLDNVERLDVLPFHQMGRFKWKKPGIQYQLENVEPPSLESVQTHLRSIPIRWTQSILSGSGSDANAS